MKLSSVRIPSEETVTGPKQPADAGCGVFHRGERRLSRGTLAVALGATFFAGTQTVSGAILTVDPQNGPYAEIQTAIDAAADGDTLDIAPGSYPEELFITDKDITLRSMDSDDQAILDGEGNRRILLCRESATTLQDLTFRNASSDFGAAVYSVAGALHIDGCRFLDNRALFSDGGESNFGGAIYCTAPTAYSTITATLFVNNRTRDFAFYGLGGAIAFTAVPGSGAPFAERYRNTATPPATELSVTSCTFLGGVAGRGTAIYASAESFLQVEQCLFLDDAPANSLVMIEHNDALPQTECCLVWPYGLTGTPVTSASPPGLGDVLFADPRRCPDDTLSLHHTSPAFLQSGCGTIGNLPEGCNGTIVFSVAPSALRPEPQQVIQVHGFDLAGIDDVALVGSTTTEIATSITIQDTWLTATFHLAGSRSGDRELLLRRGGTELARVPEALLVSPVEIYGFVDGWFESAGPVAATLVGRSQHDQLHVELRHGQDGSILPVRLGATGSADTLSASFDASAASLGLYDLFYRDGSQKEQILESAFFLGASPVVHVPEDYPTVQQAVDSSPPGARIVLAPQTFPEAVVIDRPLRLAADPDARATIDVNGLQTRGITVLAQAGPLVQLTGLVVTRGDLPSGDGGGIWSGRMVKIDRCRIFRCRTRSGNGGGAALAPGSRMIATRVESNATGLSLSDPDAWPLWSAPNRGLGGGVFALDCSIDSCSVTGNTGAAGGGLVVRGIVRDTAIGGNQARDETVLGTAANEFIVQGTFLRNVVSHENHATYEPISYGVVEGPSEVSFNTFTDYVQPEIGGLLTSILVRGSARVHHNSLAGVGMVFCPFYRLEPEDRGQLEVYSNIVPRMPDWMSPYSDWCATSPTRGPVFEIPESLVDFHCNLGTAMIFAGTHDVLAGCDDCLIDLDPLYCDVIVDTPVNHSFDLRIQPGSPGLPEFNPFECPDTLGALGVGCEVNPILILGSEVRRLPTGAVELRWRPGPDLAAIGFEVDRIRDGLAVPATASPLAPCTDCVFIDAGAPPDAAVSYELVVLFGSEQRLRIPLGSAPPWDQVLVPEIARIDPNPGRSFVHVAFTTDRSGDWRLELIDAAGRIVSTLWSGATEPGWHEETVTPGAHLPGGVYWVRLADRRSAVTRKLVLIP